MKKKLIFLIILFQIVLAYSYETIGGTGASVYMTNKELSENDINKMLDALKTEYESSLKIKLSPVEKLNKKQINCLENALKEYNVEVGEYYLTVIVTERPDFFAVILSRINDIDYNGVMRYTICGLQGLVTSETKKSLGEM